MTPKMLDPARTAEVEGTILDASRDLLAQGGVEGLSMRLIADRVGISATAIYHYFSGKDELIHRVVERGFRQFGEYLRAAADAHPRGSLARVQALGEAYLRFAFENEASFRVLFNIQRSDPPRTLEDLPDGGGYGLLRQAVVDAMEAGVMRRADPDLVVLFLWSLTHGLITISLACRIQDCSEHQLNHDPNELLTAFGTFIRNGIRAPASPAADPMQVDGGN
jgi:AcrR family transcriptional regulator